VIFITERQRRNRAAVEQRSLPTRPIDGVTSGLRGDTWFASKRLNGVIAVDADEYDWHGQRHEYCRTAGTVAIERHASGPRVTRHEQAGRNE
jgi:hypothetical protein